MIRVALFIDNGPNSGYRGVVPAVTLQSDSGIKATLTDAQSSFALTQAAGESARYRVDQYRLLAAETADFQEAKKIAQSLSQQSLDAAITVDTSGGKPLYSVLSGSYETGTLAQSAAQTVRQKTGLNPTVVGPFRLEAGKYATVQEAEKEEAVYEQKGIRANVARLLDGQTVKYGVWLGQGATEADRQALLEKLKPMFPGKTFQPPTARLYVVQEKVAAGNTTADTLTAYAFSPVAKIRAVPNSSSGAIPSIKVVERSNRKYRGTIELLLHKGYLTVVNELPLEQYLYGVVGTEMATGWPLEALKAQAVLARTLAMGQGNKYGVANVSDSVYEQAYYGLGKEAEDVRQAVDQTAGIVIRYQGKLTSSLFYSNAGGMTADGSEVWGNKVSYLPSVPSPDDEPQKSARLWYRVSTPDGAIGYVRNDLVTLTGQKTPLGLRTGKTNTDNLNFRTGPSTVYHKATRTLPLGTELIILAEAYEENAYSWIRGPFSSEEVTAMLNAQQKKMKAPLFSSPVQRLVVTQYGPSGRVMAMQADGKPVAVPYPDAFRSVFQQEGTGLKSTLFRVEETGAYTVLGAGGQTVSFPSSGKVLYAIGADTVTPLKPNGSNNEFVLYGKGDQWRVVTKSPAFVIHGKGFGHGLGLSQFGAKALAEKGYDYLEILQYYYKNVTIGP